MTLSSDPKASDKNVIIIATPPPPLPVAEPVAEPGGGGGQGEFQKLDKKSRSKTGNIFKILTRTGIPENRPILTGTGILPVDPSLKDSKKSRS